MDDTGEDLDDAADAAGYWEDRGGYRAFVPTAAPTGRSGSRTVTPATVPTATATAGAPVPSTGDPWGRPASGYQGQGEITRRTDPVAIVALVLGFVGVLGLPFGAWARARTRRSGDGGAGLATAGMVLSGLWTALLAVGVAAVLLVDDPEEPAPGSAPAVGTNLKVGQCLIGVTADPSDLRSVPCSQSHEAEVYAVFPVGSPSWPGTKAIEDKANNGCSKRFETFVGRAGVASGAYDVQYFHASEEAYRVGRRSIACILVDVDGKRLIGTAKA